ncbi:hypothetical protein ACTOJ1_000158 [Shigella flexneri]
MLSNFFYIFKFLLIAVFTGAIMIALGMMLKLGDIGIYIQPILVGGGSALIVLGISRQISTMKEDGYFDNFSFKNIFKKKNKKKVINKSVKTTTKKTEPVSVKKEAVDKK